MVVILVQGFAKMLLSQNISRIDGSRFGILQSAKR